MRTLYTSLALAAIMACQQAFALTLTSADAPATLETPQYVPTALAQTKSATKIKSNAALESDSDSDDDDCCHHCHCPHLQDCGIVTNTGAGIG